MNSAFYKIISATTVMCKSLILVLYMLQHLVCISYNRDHYSYGTLDTYIQHTYIYLISRSEISNCTADVDLLLLSLDKRAKIYNTIITQHKIKENLLAFFQNLSASEKNKPSAEIFNQIS